MILPTSTSTVSGSISWLMQPTSQILTHSIHSEQTPQFRQRLASSTAVFSSSPSSTSVKPSRLAVLRVGMAGRAFLATPSVGTSSTFLRGSGRPSLRSTPRSWRSIDIAASLPAATAVMTSAGPATTSPPAKTPSILVCSVVWSTLRVPQSV